MNSEPIPAVFMHIQKTAGTSIVDLAWKHYGYSTISHGDYVDHKPEAFKDKQFVSGHFGYDFARYFMPTRYSFTFLRDPVERILSFYFFCRSRDPNELPIYRAACELELDQFLDAGTKDPLIMDRIWNGQTWRLARGCPNGQNQAVNDLDLEDLLKLAVSHLHDFSHIGFTESFDTDRDVILKALGIDIPEHETRSNVTAGRPQKEDLPANTLKLVEALTELDKELFKTALATRKPNP